MGKVLAGLLLLIGGGITLYILYKVMFAVVEPRVTRKLEQKMAKDKLSPLQNNLTIHHPANNGAKDKE